MASDKNNTPETNRGRLPSAHKTKTPHLSAIPKIVLDEGAEPPKSPVTVTPVTSSIVSPLATCSPQGGYTEVTATQSGSKKCRNQIPVRSSSDIGLPATSMPNLASQMGLPGGIANNGSENNLGVYCSPRTSRRSVDLDINSKAETRGQYEWIETLDSSSNTLKVLTASSRAGSALSLNSECTTRSIGLLSNDSDSDDLSVSDKDRSIDRPTTAQFRRYLSYPEESPNPDASARPSQSLCNLKQADGTVNRERVLRTGQSLDCSVLGRTVINDTTRRSNQSFDTQRSSFATESDESRSFAVNLDQNSVVDSVGDSDYDNVKKRLNNVGLRMSGGFRKSENILCYKCDTNAPSRDGRIRQWLQDMDHQQDYTD